MIAVFCLWPGAAVLAGQDRASPDSGTAPTNPSTLHVTASPPDPARQIAAAPPIRLGAFDVTPVFRQRLEYDDNIHRSDRNRRADVISRSAASLAMAAGWSRARLRLDAMGEAGMYGKSSSDNFQDGNVLLGGGIDPGGILALDARIGAARHHEDRGTPDLPGTADAPAIYREFFTEFSALLRQGDIDHRLTLAQSRFDYNDVGKSGGGIINNQDRNRDETRLTLRSDIPAGFRGTAFVETTINQRDYQSPQDDEGINRDSNGYRVLAGIRLDLTDLIEGDIAFGWMAQNYDDPTLPPLEGPSARAGLAWHVTRLSRIDIAASRETGETTIRGAGGTIRQSYRASLSHELRHAIDLRINGGVMTEEFVGIGRTDQTEILGAGMRYDLNRHADLDLGWQYDTRQSDQDDLDYHRNRFVLSLAVRM